ncbi:DUF2795 domain-containing protein [Mycobacterium paraense]|uniref:DUF2795 domain-containing protein n=1 Tax=Mycobacterium paraense TaxID=767916 RepID=UPI000A2242AE|nr:DUF2795 domain-containing protein [Mycobacterium paraense]MCV7441869.1 DUF2795 domain-containing protein [Mycobacterium paraense]ORW40900.1 hypothetical protein AWB89_20375 [Mycobacterium paraense]
MDFPANKQDLLDAADRNGCDEQTVRALRGIPPETYTNVGQVAASVTIADDQDDAGKSAPGSPIVEELGENRGS